MSAEGAISAMSLHLSFKQVFLQYNSPAQGAFFPLRGPVTVFFFSREKKLSTREKYRFFSRENLVQPVKKSLKPPVKNNFLP